MIREVIDLDGKFTVKRLIGQKVRYLRQDVVSAGRSKVIAEWLEEC